MSPVLIVLHERTVLYVGGQLDDVEAQRIQDAWAQAIPECRLVIITGAMQVIDARKASPELAALAELVAAHFGQDVGGGWAGPWPDDEQENTGAEA